MLIHQKVARDSHMRCKIKVLTQLRRVFMKIILLHEQGLVSWIPVFQIFTYS